MMVMWQGTIDAQNATLDAIDMVEGAAFGTVSFAPEYTCE